MRSLITSRRTGELRSLTVFEVMFSVNAIEAFLERLPPKLHTLSFGCFHRTLWTDEKVAALYGALLRLPADTSLKKLELPSPRGEEDATAWAALKERFKVTA